ncbi:MFS transporter [Yinghuangia sp. YIM S09857]|uniref:MFS transporter n=1 Tax=Yinghuangia sp. YIM S09857 TaxID=3436929 RepID=UPI003F536900
MRLGEIAADTTPLRESREFRLLFAASALSMLGTALTSVAASIQVYDIGGSSLHVGMVNIVIAVSLCVGLLTGGVVADRTDRRRIILGTRAGAAVVVLALAVNALADNPRLWVIYLLAVAAGLVNGLGAPALMAVTPALVGRRQLAAAGALLTLTTQFGAMVGPMVAGLVAAGPGVATCYLLDASGFAIGAVLLWRLPELRPERPESGAGAGPGEGAADTPSDAPTSDGLAPEGPASARSASAAKGSDTEAPAGEAPDAEPEGGRPLHEIAAGFRHVRADPVIRALMLVDLFAVILAMPYALFPQMGEHVFDGGPITVGLLYSAPSVGAFLGALTSGWTGRSTRPGVALGAAAAGWGLAVAAFGAAELLWLALPLLALAGYADTISEILRRTLIQAYTPDHLQGRVGSLWLAQATAAPSAGNALAGGGAKLVAPGTVLMAGGVACVAAVGAVSWGSPALRKATLTGGADEDPAEPGTERTADTAAGAAAGTGTGAAPANGGPADPAPVNGGPADPAPVPAPTTDSFAERQDPDDRHQPV